MDDPWNPSYTTYAQADLGLMGILKNICPVRVMSSMEENSNEEVCIRSLRILSADPKLDEICTLHSAIHNSVS